MSNKLHINKLQGSTDEELPILGSPWDKVSLQKLVSKLSIPDSRFANLGNGQVYLWAK